VDEVISDAAVLVADVAGAAVAMLPLMVATFPAAVSMAGEDGSKPKLELDGSKPVEIDVTCVDRVPKTPPQVPLTTKVASGKLLGHGIVVSVAKLMVPRARIDTHADIVNRSDTTTVLRFILSTPKWYSVPPVEWYELTCDTKPENSCAWGCCCGGSQSELDITFDKPLFHPNV
jgi:hypothetical protein